MSWLEKIIFKEEKIIIGLMSGTSMDGIDAILVKLSGFDTETKFDIIGFDSFEYSEDLHFKLTGLNQPVDIKELSDINFITGYEFADAAIKIVDKFGLDMSCVDLIGSHGQTVFHNPPSNDDHHSSTMQIGEPDVICQKTGITTIGDFRARDVAAGGEGAPLITYVDYILFHKLKKNIIAQNIGGISNCSLITGTSSEIKAFDSGPGNSLLDEIVRLHSDGQINFDKNGELSSKGSVNGDILSYLLSDPYFDICPPKSTGKEKFGQDKAKEVYTLAKSKNVNINDLLATLVEFTCETIYESYRKFIFDKFKIEEVILSGGGAMNPHIVTVLQQKLEHIPLKLSDEFGIPAESKEALGFAILANQTIHGLCSNLPSVTGASANLPLGKISIGEAHL